MGGLGRRAPIIAIAVSLGTMVGAIALRDARTSHSPNDRLSSSGPSQEPSGSSQEPFGSTTPDDVKANRSGSPLNRQQPGSTFAGGSSPTSTSGSSAARVHIPFDPKNPSDPALNRSEALWPHPSELTRRQAEVNEGQHQELLDAKAVAAAYLKDRYGATVAARKDELRVGEVEPRATGSVRVPFGGIHDIRPGGVYLRRYNHRNPTPGDIWYVYAADTPGFSIPGGGVGSDSYQNGVLKLDFLGSENGTVDLVIEAYGRQKPVLEKSFSLRAGHFTHIEQRVLDPVNVHVKATFRGEDGRVGILEMTRFYGESNE